MGVKICEGFGQATDLSEPRLPEDIHNRGHATGSVFLLFDMRVTRALPPSHQYRDQNVMVS